MASLREIMRAGFNARQAKTLLGLGSGPAERITLAGVTESFAAPANKAYKHFGVLAGGPQPTKYAHRPLTDAEWEYYWGSLDEKPGDSFLVLPAGRYFLASNVYVQFTEPPTAGTKVTAYLNYIPLPEAFKILSQEYTTTTDPSLANANQVITGMAVLETESILLPEVNIADPAMRDKVQLAEMQLDIAKIG